jgi:hypothetical protein
MGAFFAAPPQKTGLSALTKTLRVFVPLLSLARAKAVPGTAFAFRKSASLRIFGFPVFAPQKPGA